MTLAQPYMLFLLALLPVMAVLRNQNLRASVVPVPTIDALAAGARSVRVSLRWVPLALRLASLALLVLALARPREPKGWTTTTTEGLAIQIVLDRSGSMREPMGGSDASKSAIARKTISDFVGGNAKDLKGRAGDMIGLIAFARYADTVSPLARVHQPLLDAAARLEPVEVRQEDGTAIGDALALAAARLKRADEDVARQKPADGTPPEFQIKSKVVILMTDGQNNAGDISPYDAAAQAKEWGIRVYTIGIGAGERTVTMNTPFGPQKMPMGSDVDERMLRDIAASTGGAYFSGDSPSALRDAYAAIDQLEKTKIDSTEHTAYAEHFAPLGVGALALLALELLLSGTCLRRVP